LKDEKYPALIRTGGAWVAGFAEAAGVAGTAGTVVIAGTAGVLGADGTVGATGALGAAGAELAVAAEGVSFAVSHPAKERPASAPRRTLNDNCFRDFEICICLLFIRFNTDKTCRHRVNDSKEEHMDYYTWA